MTVGNGSDDDIGLWIRIFHINDVYELDNFPSLQTLIKDLSKPNGFHSKIADGQQKEAQQEQQSRQPDAVWVILAGDFLGPSLLSSLDDGTSMVDCLNAIGCHYVCIGNHEADVSMEELQARIQQSKFPWINSNMRELNDKLGFVPGSSVGGATPEYEIVDVQSETVKRRIGILGLLTNDPTLYRPGSYGNARIDPLIETTQNLLERLMKRRSNTKKGGSTSSESNSNNRSLKKRSNSFDGGDEMTVDFMLPLTHQLISDDRIFCEYFGGSVFPIVLGGHDHDPYDETLRGSRIIKSGTEAENTNVIDLVWNKGSTNRLPDRIQVELVKTASFPPDAAMLKRVEAHQSVLKELEKSTLFTVKDWIPKYCRDQPFSTRENRIAPSTGTTALCSMIRMGLHADCAILNAGSVRGNKIYPPDHKFTWSDLKIEIPYPVPMVEFMVPGHVLEATVRYSRRDAYLQPRPVARGGFLHGCNQLNYCMEEKRILKIGKQDFDPNKLYNVALSNDLLKGIDNQEPLLKWAAENNVKIDDDSAIPSKNLIVHTFSNLLWLDLGSFYEIDKDQDGMLTREDVHAHVVQKYGEEVSSLIVEHIFKVADLSRTGYITPMDMTIVRYAAHEMVNGHVTRRESIKMKEMAASVLNRRASNEEVKNLVDQIRAKVDLSQEGTMKKDDILRYLKSSGASTQEAAKEKPKEELPNKNCEYFV